MNKGFNIIDLLIVVSIIGIIAALILPQLASHMESSNKTVELNMNEWSCTKMTKGKVEKMILMGKVLMPTMVDENICIEYRMNGTENVKLN